jgi:hypothetical protein
MILLGFPVIFFVTTLSFFILLLDMAPHYLCLYTLVVDFKNKYIMIIFTIPELKKYQSI